MFGTKRADTATAIALLCAVLLTAVFIVAGATGAIKPARADAYMERLFAAERVHTIDIVIDDWDAFIAAAPTETYTRCDLVIDGERIRGVGLRAKGNNSLGHMAERGLSRYSLKVEFDHYERGLTYYGLDKLSLDAAFQDNSYLKTYLAYDMMRHMGVPAPATSFTWVTVNGEPWGLFLAVEDPEDAYTERLWGAGHGALYKPDYRSLEDENADVALRYTDDDPASYPGIFDRARVALDPDAEGRLIEALRLLAAGDRASIERSVDVDLVLRYFAVQTFVANLDGYLGSTGHNYLLYEEDGRIAMLPWDYNLAFGTYALGRRELPDDAGTYVNLPIDEPAAPEVLAERPLFTNLMAHAEYRDRYHAHLDEFVAGYVESGLLSERVATAVELIAPYVAEDPTAFCTYGEFLTGASTIEAFCQLRGQSVREQLAGGIPATWKGQAAAPASLVDASSIALEDLGELADLDATAETGERDGT